MSRWYPEGNSYIPPYERTINWPLVVRLIKSRDAKKAWIEFDASSRQPILIYNDGVLIDPGKLTNDINDFILAVAPNKESTLLSSSVWRFNCSIAVDRVGWADDYWPNEAKKLLDII